MKVINRKDDRTAGMASLEITSAKDCAGLGKEPAADGGRQWRVHAQRPKSKSNPAQAHRSEFEFWSFDGKRLSEKHVAPSKSDEWQTVSVEAIAPESSAHVIAVIEGAKDSDGISFWDEVELHLAPPRLRSGDRCCSASCFSTIIASRPRITSSAWCIRRRSLHNRCFAPTSPGNRARTSTARC